jgi:hypothetical protein
MCTLKLPLGFLDHMEGFARGFFRRSKDIEKRVNVLSNGKRSVNLRRQGVLGCLASEFRIKLF